MPAHADPIEMQHRLFAELSAMFGEEVPMYARAVAVNEACNRAVCNLLEAMHPGFRVGDEQLRQTSGERHGAIRIGTADEMRWVGRFFACFGMRPHSFYDMTDVGAKSQPVIATVFRSPVDPEHRVFTSLLCTDYFDDETMARLDALVAGREIWSAEARELIERCEREGGLSWSDAEALIAEATGRIFKWTGRARDHALYTHLCEAGFKIAADIACFERHHLNHLTPNTLCMDLYTAAMKRCLGGIDSETFRERAIAALERLERDAGEHYLRLHFRHLTSADIRGFGPKRNDARTMMAVLDHLQGRIERDEFGFAGVEHNGFKDSTEGPSADTPVLLRQDAYRALTEAVVFTEADAAVVNAGHTARFGEIEQRFFAPTPEGRALYDECLEAAEEWKAADPGLPVRDHDAYVAGYAEHFARFPKSLGELVQRGLVYVEFAATPAGIAARGSVHETDLRVLVGLGYAEVRGLRYEDFLPVSAAGIFASNLSQYGTRSTADQKPEYTKAALEEVLGMELIDPARACLAMQSRTALGTYRDLGLIDRLDPADRERLESQARYEPGTVRSALA